MDRPHSAGRVPGRVPGRPLGRAVLAQRNQAAAAVGAWVESGEELREHPAALAALTEQQEQRRRLRSEQHLRLFQETVRLRVAEQERRRRRQRAGPQAPQSAAGERDSSPCDDRTQSGAWVRRRLARPRPPEPEDDDDDAAQRQSLTAHKDGGQEENQPVREESVYRELWPMDRSEEIRRQRQTQILTQRRLFLSKDRQNVKENQEHKRHALRTASLKQEKERARLQEEQRLKEARLLSTAREALEQRERQVQERLREEKVREALREEKVQEALREEKVQEALREEKAGGPERRDRRTPKTDRLVRVLRAQLKEIFSRSSSEPPPLCCCGSFWETHPESCANNCVFHNDHKAYVQALQTVVHSWELL